MFCLKLHGFFPQWVTLTPWLDHVDIDFGEEICKNMNLIYCRLFSCPFATHIN
jgi:hypothetical protein